MVANSGLVFLVVIVMLMALFAVSVFIVSRNRQATLKEDDMYDE